MPRALTTTPAWNVTGTQGVYSPTRKGYVSPLIFSVAASREPFKWIVNGTPSLPASGTSGWSGPSSTPLTTSPLRSSGYRLPLS